MDNLIKLILKLFDKNEISIFKAALIIFFPLYLTGKLFIPTFQSLDFCTQFSLIAGADILLNFLLLFLTNFVKEKKSDFQYRAMTYISLLIITTSIFWGMLTNFSIDVPLGIFFITALALIIINLIKHKKDAPKSPNISNH